MLESWVAFATMVVRTVCEVDSRIHRLADLAERLQLTNRLREFAGPRLHLVEQPHVLDRNHRLVGEGGDQLDLLVGERPHRLALQDDDSDRRSFAQQGNAQHCANAAHFRLFDHLVAWIGEHVGNLDRFTLRDNAADDRAATRRQRVGLDVGPEVGRVPVSRDLPIGVPLLAIDRGHVRLAKPRGGLD